ncbi:hypothetical protein NDU88_006722 [Pleurodeles waltl]|uniref:Uncharacterized protein n=1 Tax=Pleurodeles waltl TaxID=8319 RepID=A0AAV7WF16_PLEWA|nr:hypothetical protein NDU88_006722 [Pleurodeles waltl]
MRWNLIVRPPSLAHSRERTRTRGLAELNKARKHRRDAPRRIPRLCPVTRRALPRPGRCAAAKREAGKPCRGLDGAWQQKGKRESPAAASMARGTWKREKVSPAAASTARGN